MHGYDNLREVWPHPLRQAGNQISMSQSEDCSDGDYPEDMAMKRLHYYGNDKNNLEQGTVRNLPAKEQSIILLSVYNPYQNYQL